jgi:hypothetical protein
MPGEDLSKIMANKPISSDDIKSLPSFVKASPEDKRIVQVTVLDELTPVSVESSMEADMGQGKAKQKILTLPGQERTEEQTQAQTYSDDNIVPLPVMQAKQATEDVQGSYQNNVLQFPTAEARVKKPAQQQDDSNRDAA